MRINQIQTRECVLVSWYFIILLNKYFTYLLATVCEATASSTSSTTDVLIVSAPPLSEKNPFCEVQATEKWLINSHIVH